MYTSLALDSSMAAHACPFCTGALKPIFASRDYLRPNDDRVYEVGWCDTCTYGRVLGKLSPDEVGEFYDIPYYTHQATAAESAPPSLAERILMNLAWRRDHGSELNANEGVGRTLLDVGCGNGGNMQKFYGAGYEVTGVEPDSRARAVASKIGSVYEGTAESIPAGALGQFDTVLFSHVLEHCIDPGAALRNARRLIAPSGRLIVEVPNNAAAGFGMFKHLWPWTDVPRHLHFFTEASMNKLLGSAGFKSTKVLHVGYLRQFHPQWIRTQAQIWRGTIGGPGMPRFTLAAWRLLAQTCMAGAERKYDSIRLHAEPI
jgi:SAM-dependent methyltransferase